MASSIIERLLLRVEADTSKLDPQLNAVQKKIARANKAFGSAFKLAARGALAATAAISGLGIAASLAVTAADNVAKTADAIGISTDALQQYRFAADLAGVSQESLDGALTAFIKRLGEARAGKGTLVELLKAMNASLLENVVAAGSSEDALKSYFRALGETGNAADKAALSAAAFGRQAGVQMVLLVKRGAAELERMRARASALGIVLDEDLLRQAERTKDAMTILGKVVSANVMRAMLQLAPVIERIAKGFADAAPAINRALGSLGKFVGLLERSPAEKIKRIRADLEGIRNMQSVGSFGRGTLRGVFGGLVEIPTDKELDATRRRLEAELRLQKIILDERKRLAGRLPDRRQLTAASNAGAPPSTASLASGVKNKAVLAALVAERDALAATARERFLDVAQRRLSATASAGQRRQVRELAGALFDEKAALALRNAEAMRARGIIEELRTPQEQHAARIREITDLYQRGFISLETYNSALRAAGDEVSDFASEAGRAFDSATQSLLDFTTSGKLELEDLRRIGLRTISDIAGAALRELGGGKSAGSSIGKFLAKGIRSLFNPGSSGGGGFLTFGGPRAGGGPVLPGSAFLVGEQGRELFVPDSPGTVVNAASTQRMLGGARGGITVNYSPIIDARGAQRGVAEEIDARLAAREPVITANTIAALRGLVNEGGEFAKTMGRR